jgi:outer membrane protein assembly factor BamB
MGSVAIIALMIGYWVALSRMGVLPRIFVEPKDPATEAHYDELERHRAAQRESSPQTEAQPAATSATANANVSTPSATPAAATSARSYWTDYRGSNRDGRYEETRISSNWPAGGLSPLWKIPVGGGYASFVSSEGRIFTIEQRRTREVVAAYDISTGREIWIHAYDAEFRESMGGDGPRATPTWHEGKIYSLGATGELRCLDAKIGRLIWSKNILSDNGAQNLDWGMAASPLIVDDKVIVQPGGRGGKSVVAYNKLTGQRVWSALDDRQAYVSPMLVTLAGVRQILVVTSTRVAGLAVESGSLLFEQAWNTSMGINCSQPVIVGPNRFFISSGYGKGAALIEVTQTNGGLTARALWENTSMKNKFNSSVFHEGHIYGLDEGILTCLEAETGARKWKEGRFGYGQLLLADGHLIVLSDQGELALIKATPEGYAEVAKFSALEGKTWNYPAIVAGKLLVRNATEMACFNISGS